MRDSLMTPADVCDGCVAAWGRPALDPCWHPASPVAPVLALTIHDLVPLVIGGRCHPDVIRSTSDGLAEDWTALAGSGWVWLNPPYSRPGPWLAKLVTSGVRGAALVKLDPTTRWWADSIRAHSTARGDFTLRLRYPRTDGGPQMAANFPSSLILFGGLPRPAGLALDWTQ